MGTDQTKLDAVRHRVNIIKWRWAGYLAIPHKTIDGHEDC